MSDITRQTFDSQPVPPYNVGDIWIDETDTEYICITSRESGETFDANDWIPLHTPDEDGDPVDTGDAGETDPIDEEPVDPVDDDGNRPEIDWDETMADGTGSPQRTFTTQPVPPYNVGDIWIEDGVGEYICVVSKGDSETFSMDDWKFSIAPSEDSPTVTTSSYVEEIISDYSPEALAEYEASGAVPIAVYDDGTTAEVAWSSVTNPAPSAVTAVNEAAQVANAMNQHFWTDTQGIHVTEAEQDTFIEQPSGANILENANGILLRDGETWLSQFTPGNVAFYDGTGNEFSNVVAIFGGDGAKIGKDGEIHLEQGASGVSIVDDAGDELLTFGVSERDGDSYASIISNTLNTLINGTTGSFEISGRLLTVAGTDRAIVSGPVASIRADHQVSVVSDGDVTIAAAPTGTNTPILNLENGSTTFLTHGGDVVFDTNGLVPEQGNGSIRGIGAETLSGHNLSPFFAHDLTDRTYWYNGPSVTALLNASSYTADGWAHVSIPATSANTLYYLRIARSALEGVVPSGEDVTLLVELANVSTTGTVEGKLVQPSNMTGELVQLSGSQDVADGKHWFDGTATGTGGEGLCLQLWQGTVACEFDVRVSLFKGKYRGAYKPYVVPECELSEVLGLAVDITTTAEDIATAATGFELTSAQYAVYGKMAQLTVYVKSTNALTSGTGYTIATLTEGKRPIINPSTASLGTTTAVYGNVQINSNGNILFRPSANVAANTSFRINATYILA